MTKTAIQAASELLLPSIRKAVACDDAHVDAGTDASKVVAAVTKEVARDEQRALVPEPFHHRRAYRRRRGRYDQRSSPMG